MFQQLLSTPPTLTGFILRLTLGLVIFPHGAQKLFGAFGGPGFSGAMGFLTDGAGLPWIIALLVILIESLGALLLILGLFGRLNAALIGILMVGAILTAHADNGFFMNWSGKQAGEGFEYHLLALGIALALVVDGSGKYSIDRALKKRRK